MRKFLAGFATVSIVIIAVLVGYQYLTPPPPPPPPPPLRIVDHLCKFVHDEQGMTCVRVLASDTFMKPGAIVEYRASSDDRVTLPVADLFSTDLGGHASCLVPGVDVASMRSALSQPRDISIPQMTYDVDRNLHIGADVEIPQLYGSTFKAGPKWSNVGKIDLGNDEAWAIQLDEFAAVNAYRSCRILKSCTDHIAASRYRVIGTAIVAKGVNYKVYDKRGDLISLDTAAKSGEFTTSVGGSSELTATSDSTIKAAGNRVVGVRLMPTEVFAGAQACGETIAFDPPTASSSVTIVGGGGKASIGAPQNQVKPIGESAKLSATGTEESECNAEFERKTSGASAEARVDPDGPGAVRFNYRIEAAGGHYVTAAGCEPGSAIKTGHDTSATASAELMATIYVILRADTPPLRVTYDNVPNGTNIRLVNWQGRPLQVMRTEFRSGERIVRLENMPAAVSGSGSEAFSPMAPGYYRLEARFQLNASVTGNADDVRTDTASIRVALDQ
jgi:hypothetical protein